MTINRRGWLQDNIHVCEKQTIAHTNLDVDEYVTYLWHHMEGWNEDPTTFMEIMIKANLEKTYTTCKHNSSKITNLNQSLEKL